MRVCLVSFSGRSGGNCGTIAEKLRQSWTDGDEVVVFDFAALTITPCGRCGCECFQVRERCPYFDDPEVSICDTITRSDLTCFIVPNYCDYPCANFLFLMSEASAIFSTTRELLEQYLSVRKKFVVISNTGRENFQTAFRYHVPEGSEPDVLFLSAKQFHKVSIQGDLMDAPEAWNAVFRFIKGGI